jgi:ABC-type nitrate/sulfonate/bicarbonate transport system substrate-binding protein
VRLETSVIILASALFVPGVVWGAESLQKIRIGFPSLAFSYIPFYTAQERGLLRKAGLEAEYIQMRTGIQPQAVINGNINFFPSISTGLSAAVSGLPLTVVLNLYNGTPWILVTSREVLPGAAWPLKNFLLRKSFPLNSITPSSHILSYLSFSLPFVV